MNTLIDVQDENEGKDNDNDISVYYMHIHIAKTAGSSFNRYMARTYHNVCGNKGSSYNEDMKQLSNNNINNVGSTRNSKNTIGDSTPPSSDFNNNNNNNTATTLGSGYDDSSLSWYLDRNYCKFISHEEDSNTTVRMIEYLKAKEVAEEGQEESKGDESVHEEDNLWGVVRDGDLLTVGIQRFARVSLLAYLVEVVCIAFRAMGFKNQGLQSFPGIFAKLLYR